MIIQASYTGKLYTIYENDLSTHSTPPAFVISAGDLVPAYNVIRLYPFHFLDALFSSVDVFSHT